jgi:hypothetical protein
MSKVDEVREDGELSKSPAEQSLSRAFAAGAGVGRPQRRPRSPTALFARPLSLVWSSGQDVQKRPAPQPQAQVQAQVQGKTEQNASRRQSLWVLFGSLRS